MTHLTLPLLARTQVALIAVALGLLAPVARSASICRWEDENGRTQMSDVVPDKYAHSATCIDSRQYELSAQQRREAELQAAREQRRMHREIAEPPSPAASSAAATTGAGSVPSAKQPAEVITDATDCQTRWRIYNESVECFGPYRTTRGATKPEGFEKCNDITSPEIKCGPQRN